MTEEDQIHFAVVELLRLRKVLFWHVPNGTAGPVQWKRKLKRLGHLAGVPDIAIVLNDGRAAFMEVKSPSGRLSTAQKDFRAAALKAGACWAEVRSVDDAVNALKVWSA